MKLRNPTLIKWVAFLVAIVIRVWISTVSFRYRPFGPRLAPVDDEPRGPFLYVFWHENILVPCFQFARPDILVLISQHADGEVIAQVCKHMGFGTVRGSSTRGGMKAMREMIRAAKTCNIAVMPDGPRGPRRHVEPGVIFLAAKTGLPIVVMGIGHDRPWRLNTWDQFVLPRPFSQAVMVSFDPIHIPANATKAELEQYRQQVEKALNDATDYAEHLASQ
ncbi:MAG: lysophospholipid acyltransferase family protein [Planctomycetes bacterium]|nr:lysophospholipid acyltransferase family protein [Planctomycetota bacterium]